MAEAAVSRPDPAPRAIPPATGLRIGLRNLADLLLERPHPPAAELLPMAQALCRTFRELELPHGLPHLVLRNLLADLRGQAPLDASYYASQLSRAADHLDA